MTPDRTGVAILSLLVGAAGAPTYCVISGVVAPQGFADFRGAALLTIAPVAFIAAYLFSAAFTAVIGGVAWRWLHKARLDGFLSYLGIAVAAAVALELAAGRSSANPEALLMAAVNAVVVRLAELHFRSRDGARREANRSV